MVYIDLIIKKKEGYKMEKIDKIVVVFMLTMYASVYLIAIYAENLI